MPVLLLILLFFLGNTLNNAHAAAPPLMLANSWQDGPDVSRYLVSEKLDGVRPLGWACAVDACRPPHCIAGMVHPRLAQTADRR